MENVAMKGMYHPARVPPSKPSKHRSRHATERTGLSGVRMNNVWAVAHHQAQEFRQRYSIVPGTQCSPELWHNRYLCWDTVQEIGHVIFTASERTVDHEGLKSFRV